MRGADGVKLAVLRKGPASLTLIRAAAHAHRWASKREDDDNIYNHIAYGNHDICPRY
jgi:hypothetical protein